MKKILIGIGVFLLAIVIIAVIAINVLVNETVIKNKLVEQVKQRTEQNFAIEGELKLTFYPKIGFSIEQIKLFNKPDYADAKQVEITKINLAVDVMSLLSKTIVIDQVEVDGVTVNLETLADGRNNMQELLAKVSPAVSDSAIINEDIKTVEVTKEGEAVSSEYEFVIGGIKLLNTQVSFNNRQDGKYHKLSDTSLTIGQFKFDQNVPIALTAHYRSNEMNAQLDSQLKLLVDKAISEITVTDFKNNIKLVGALLPRPEMTVKLNTDARFNVSNKTLDLTKLLLAVDELAVQGKLSADVLAKPSLNYDLAINTVVVDDWLPKSTQAETASSADNNATKYGASSNSANQTVNETANQPVPVPEVEPDLSALSSVDEKGKLVIKQVRYGEYVLDNVKLVSQLSKGVLNISEFSAALYEGKIKTAVILDSNAKPARFEVKGNIDGVQSEQLVTIATGKKWVTGKLDAVIAIKGQGLTQTRLKSASTGIINTSFADGAILGVNVAQEVRDIIAKFTGEKGKANTSKNTDFSSLIANFNLGKGKLTSTKIAMHSPAINVDGKGYVNLLSEYIDFNFGAKITEDIGGRNSSTMKTVRNLRFPVDIKGPMIAPKIKFDTSSLTKQLLASKEDKLKKSASKRLDKLLGDDPEKQKLKKEIFKGLDKLFN